MRLDKEGWAKPVLLGDPEVIDPAAERGIEVIDPQQSDLASHPLLFAAMMVAEGQADAMIAGGAHSMSEVFSAALPTIGLAAGVSAPSSFVLMEWPEGSLVFADAAVMVEPSAEELAGIAVLTAFSAGLLLGVEPRGALVASSSRHSVDPSPSAELIADAVLEARELAPGFSIDGPLSVKAALADGGAVSVLPDSPLQEAANVLVFPHLDAASTGYKLMQCLAGARAIGPVMQGFARPVGHFSRLASVGEMVDLATIASIQA